MQVYSIDTNFKTKPHFGYWRREKKVGGKVIVRNDTCFFREQNFFQMLTKFFSEQFKNKSRVNVYSYGCSDGSEPFTFVMQMLTMEDEKNPQKFFPIIARDNDPIAIQKAMKNDYKIIKNEKEKIDFFTNGQYDRFFYQPYEKILNNNDETLVFIKEELYDNVNFDIGDIFEDLKKIKPENTILMARNFWPYIDYQKRKNFFRELYEHLASGSYFVTGKFDQQCINWNLGDFKQEVISAGFKQTPLKYVYKK